MTKVTDKDYRKIRQYVDDFERRLIEKSLSFSEFKEVTLPLIGRSHSFFPKQTSHLKLIRVTTISATKAGKGMKQENQNLFKSVDGNFDNWDAQTVLKDTKEARAYVYKQIKNDHYPEIFGSFNKSLDLLSFETHEQIKDFVENSPDLLDRRGCISHFLFKNKKRERFVAHARRYPDGELFVRVVRFLEAGVSNAKYISHFVVLVAKTLDKKN